MTFRLYNLRAKWRQVYFVVQSPEVDVSKFFLLYLAPVSAIDQMMANSSPEQMKVGMDAWMGWMKKHEKSLADMGSPLGKTKRVTAAGAVSARNEVTGYTIVEAESHDAAVAMLAGHPHLNMPGAYIDVISVTPIPGMKT